MTEPTAKQWRRRALQAEQQVEFLQGVRASEADKEMRQFRELAALRVALKGAQEIKDSNISCDEGAERYGVDRTLISKIRRGRAWHDLTPNPFTGLGALGR